MNAEETIIECGYNILRREDVSIKEKAKIIQSLNNLGEGLELIVAIGSTKKIRDQWLEYKKENHLRTVYISEEKIIETINRTDRQYHKKEVHFIFKKRG